MSYSEKQLLSGISAEIFYFVYKEKATIINWTIHDFISDVVAEKKINKIKDSRVSKADSVALVGTLKFANWMTRFREPLLPRIQHFDPTCK